MELNKFPGICIILPCNETNGYIYPIRLIFYTKYKIFVLKGFVYDKI